MTYFQSPSDYAATYFFTVRLADPDSHLLVDEIDLLRQSVRVARERYPFDIRAAVVLPSHMHMIWTLPQDDRNFVLRWRLIKMTFSRHVTPPDPANVTPAMQQRREKGIWQRGFWDEAIRDQSDYDLHEHLIIHAPVTAGLVKSPQDWAYSSLHTRGIGPVTLQHQYAPRPAPVVSPQATYF